MYQVKTGGFIRINKRRARNLFEQGFQIRAVPVHLNPSGSIYYTFTDRDELTFDENINIATSEFCCSKFGKYLSYYIRME